MILYYFLLFFYANESNVVALAVDGIVLEFDMPIFNMQYSASSVILRPWRQK